jgi:50S ribosomal protein L4
MDAIFSIEPNDHAIYLDVKQHLANKRQGTHKSKERNEISGSTRKLKKQKGTGGARAGSIKNPLFTGGGRVFGPQPRDYSFKLNKKVKQLARKSALTYKARNNEIMVLEDFGGESLRKWMDRQTFELPEFLAIAIKTAENLGQIHAANIVHKDINPSNIVLNRDTGEVKIIDFGISTDLSTENPTFRNPNVLEGTLAYISPEQTGRMNRCLDYRTDFYSLGATFYEVLTGTLPFAATDAMELVHCHIAKMPVPPHLVERQIASPHPEIRRAV